MRSERLAESGGGARLGQCKVRELNSLMVAVVAARLSRCRGGILEMLDHFTTCPLTEPAMCLNLRCRGNFAPTVVLEEAEV